MWAKKTVKAPFGIAVSETVCKVRSDTVIRTDRFKEERRLIATIVYEGRGYSILGLLETISWDVKEGRKDYAFQGLWVMGWKERKRSVGEAYGENFHWHLIKKREMLTKAFRTLEVEGFS